MGLAKTLPFPDSADVAEGNGVPVFILSVARSGSTLLRFILDAHPQLACPPETGVGAACAHLARVNGVLDGLAQPGPPAQGSVTVRSGSEIRQAIDEAYRRYLARRGRARWCDKSLDNVVFADLIVQLWPEAQFLCLVRHCMDVIASGLEACPWGLAGFGFDQFAAQYPGNSVAAIAASWVSSMASMLAFEEKHPNQCHRIRYEDLVSEPETVAAQIFAFLGVRQVPGITRDCFKMAHEAHGPGDEKIWFTGSVRTDTIGRGLTVPAALLPPAMRERVGEILEKLGYRKVTAAWNEATVTDPRADAEPTVAAVADPAVAAAAEMIRARVTEAKSAEVAARWPHLAGKSLGIVIYSADGREELRWRLHGHGTGSQSRAGDLDPTIIGDVGTWRSLLDGKANMTTELTAGRLRCTGLLQPVRLRPDEVTATAELLGLVTVPAVTPTAAPAADRPTATGPQAANGRKPRWHRKKAGISSQSQAGDARGNPPSPAGVGSPGPGD